MLPSLFAGGSLTDIILNLLYRIPAIMIAISFHEAAHAYAAYKLGDPTARNLGRTSLNPLHHLNLVGTIMIFLVGFGWAKPVPVNTRNFKNPRRDDTIVSLAGVVTNLVTAFAFYGIWILIIYVFRFNNDILNQFILYIILINVYIAIFNLLPIPPLDGYHVLKNCVRVKNPKFFWTYEKYGFMILILFVIVSMNFNVIGFVASKIFLLFQLFYGLFL